ncbi:MFS multidrug transporter protein [Rutstroemia sp. NJR-2017a WRK4]|nr:MFS multidrug transporter protein [Rutstroemia sp. NJR-2017a WRK4]
MAIPDIEKTAESSTSSVLSGPGEENISPALVQRVEDLGLRIYDGDIVDWGSQSAAHPRNWPLRKKLCNTACIFLLDSFRCVDSLDCALVFEICAVELIAAEPAAAEYGVSNAQSLIAVSLMYGLGEALGSIVIPPYTEAFGRKPTYLVAAFLLPISCLMTGTIHSVVGAYVGRFVMGATGSVSATVVVGSLEDMWESRAQGWAIYAWVLTAGLGVALGRWLYIIGTIISSLILFLLLFSTSETRSNVLLTQHLRTLQSPLRSPTPTHQIPTFRTFCRESIILPLHLFITSPLILLTSTLASLSFSLIFLFTEALPVILLPYNFTSTTYSLGFVAFAIGMLIGIPVRVVEFRWLGRKEKERELTPEDKIGGFVTGAGALVGGLWIMAWGTGVGVGWWLPMLGLGALGLAANEVEFALGGYLTDAYTTHAASAFAAYSTLRAILSGVFPLFAKHMYQELGVHVAGTILAAVATAWLVTPWVLWRWGGRLRGMRRGVV